jgi:septum site-determining protein MinD
MSAQVITVTSGKGGVGKTTVTANVGMALALAGKKVVCIDADIGLRNLDVVLGLENRIVYDIVHVVEGRCRTRQALIRDKRVPDLYLMPAAQSRDKSAVRPEDMVRICEELRPDFDYILIDSAAGIEEGFRTALAPADLILLVTNRDPGGRTGRRRHQPGDPCGAGGAVAGGPGLPGHRPAPDGGERSSLPL